eukprot:TRINITY_DN8188_c0_g1_i1.p1 TRINITY_DN8188_c0_g1~~TRINITY_DN8188_c0_g1_i1.p1  ORF type:complete len:521 (+),score=116.27 TRINITY_DN8188_c0_g1_i1:50-1612(+)
MSQKVSKKRIIRAVKKATRSNSKPAKEKHVRVIVQFTYNRDSCLEEVIRCLTKRLDKRNWMVVLKALQLFHRCYNDNHQDHFIDALRQRSAAIFALRRFNAANYKGHVISNFIRKYAKYLEEKVSVWRLLGLQFEKDKKATKNLKLEISFRRIPKLQSQLNALLNCKIRSQYVLQNPLMVVSYVLLLKDSMPLYQSLNIGIVSLLDRFHSMGKKNASKTLEIYKLFIRETDAIISLYEMSRSFARNLPEVKKPKDVAIPSMEKHIKQLADVAEKEEEEVADDPNREDNINDFADIDDGYEEGKAASELKPEVDSESEEVSSSGEEDLPAVVPLPQDIVQQVHAATNVQPQPAPSLSQNFPSRQPQQVYVNLSGPQPFDPFGIQAENEVRMAATLPPNANPEYQKKAENIKNLVTSLYSTSFDTYNQVLSVQQPQLQPQQHVNPFEVSNQNLAPYNTNPNPGVGFGQQAVGNLVSNSSSYSANFVVGHPYNTANPFIGGTNNNNIVANQNVAVTTTNPFLM